MSVPKKERKGKVEPTLVEPAFIEAIARVRMYGNSKYPDKDNWKGNPVEFYRDAAYRHWLQYLNGEYYDKESGEPHLSHCACNLMFVFFMEERDMKNTYQRLIQQTKEVQRLEFDDEEEVICQACGIITDVWVEVGNFCFCEDCVGS